MTVARCDATCRSVALRSSDSRGQVPACSRAAHGRWPRSRCAFPYRAKNSHSDSSPSARPHALSRPTSLSEWEPVRPAAGLRTQIGRIEERRPHPAVLAEYKNLATSRHTADGGDRGTAGEQPIAKREPVRPAAGHRANILRVKEGRPHPAVLPERKDLATTRDAAHGGDRRALEEQPIAEREPVRPAAGQRT